LALDDDLMRIFNGERIQKIMGMLNIPDDEPITAKMVTRSIEGAQRKVEGHHFEVRKNLLDYDNVMNLQRQAIYTMRRNILEGKNIERTVLDMLGDVTSVILDHFIPEGAKRDQWSLEGLNNALQQQFGLRLDFSPDQNQETITQAVGQSVKTIFDRQKSTMGPFFEQILKMVLLQAIDQRWKEHLLVIDKLKEGINLRGYAQKDPIIEYKKEAFSAFEKLNDIIKSDVIEKLMKVQIVAQQAEQALESFRPDEPDLGDLDYQHPDAQAAQAPPRTSQTEYAGNGAQNGSGTTRRMTMTRQPVQDMEPKLNRADRRKLEKNKRK
jgi:preprotein translocase subunit SecA